MQNCGVLYVCMSFTYPIVCSMCYLTLTQVPTAGGTCKLCQFSWWNRNLPWQEEKFLMLWLLPHLMPGPTSEPHDRFQSPLSFGIGLNC
jgi:hypothetical protein